MSLRKTCRELVLEVVLRRALDAEGGDAPGRLQLIVDQATLRVLNSFLRMGDLLNADGVTSLELVERQREPLPGLDALYLIRPEGGNIDLVLGDFKTPTAPQHRHVHLAFAGPLEGELLARLAEGPQLAPRVKTLVEVPLGFLTVQDRGFHLDLPQALPGLFPVPDPLLQEAIGKRLADVCRCLQADPIIRYARSDLCQTLAEQVRQELSAAVDRGQARTGVHVPCHLLIVDRSVDMAATLVHEYTYESMVYDLLDGDVLDVDRNIICMPGRGGDGGDREHLLSDADNLWEELKHMHLEAAQRTVDMKIEEVKRHCEVREASQMSTGDLLKMLRQSPEQRDAIDRLNVHIFLIERIHRRLQEERLMVDVGLLEQDIACGVDKSGKDVKANSLQTQLTKIFSDFGSTVTSELKLRMLMLYLACMANVQGAVRDKLVEMARLAPEDQAVLMGMLRTRLMEVPDSQRHKLGSGTIHRVAKEQAARFKQNAQAEGRFELSRFEPRVKSLLEQLSQDRLNQNDFPTLQGAGEADVGLRLAGTMGCAPPGAPAVPVKDDWSFSAWQVPGVGAGGASQGKPTEVSQRIVLFVVGGITHSELRAAAEVRATLPRSVEVIVGGTSILTPRGLVRLLRPNGGTAAALVSGVEDPLDLT
mmetsp:Transcript_112254/g.358278  ORF Transcript_112254/g.358278 Transcript_112254/m.358278 type:complete len:648 (+) Transcript_112254:130-2073(+)